MIIAIILSLLISGALCTVLLLYVFNNRQKKISSQVAEMMAEIDKRKKEIGTMDQKIATAINYLNKMQPLDLALELEGKINSLKANSETESLAINSAQEKLKAIQEQVQNYKASREEKRKESMSEEESIEGGTENNQEIITDSFGGEINLKQLAEEIGSFIQKNETIDEKHKEVLRDAETTLNTIHGQLSSLLQIYTTSEKRVSGLDAQFKELQKEHQKLLVKVEAEAAATKTG